MFLDRKRWAFNLDRLGLLALFLGAAAFAGFVVTLERTPTVWFDETFYASTSLSLIRDGSGVPTVLADDLRVPSEILFRGPVFPALGAASFKLFGFSLTSFRWLSLGGTLLLALASAGLVRALGGGPPWAAICFALVALAPQAGSTATSGRMDPLTVGLQILGLTLLVKGIQSSIKALRLTLAFAAGVVWCLAALSTPRALPFLAAVAVGSVVFLRFPKTDRTRKVACLLIAGVVVVAGITAWTATRGITPWTWLFYLASVSSGDSTNASPLMGGNWGFQAATVQNVTPVALGLILIGLVWAARSGSRRSPEPLHTILQFGWTCVLGSACITAAIISRSQSYGLYWVIPFLPIALVQTELALRAPSAQLSARRFLLGVWICLAGSFFVIRTIKSLEVMQSWRARDHHQIEEFVKTHIPPDSKVFGPAEYYFYAVEAAGSSYRYAKSYIGKGKIRDDANPLLNSERARRASQREEGPRSQLRFLLWPDALPLPEKFQCAGHEPLARFQPASIEGAGSISFGRYAPIQQGYPETILYRIPAGCVIQ